MAVVLIVSADGQLLDRVARELEAGAYAVQREPSAKLRWRPFAAPRPTRSSSQPSFPTWSLPSCASCCGAHRT